MSILDFLFQPKPLPTLEELAPAAIFGHIDTVRAEAPAEVAECDQVVHAPPSALDAMVAVFSEARAGGLTERDAFVEALVSLRDAPILQSRGRGALRINAKSARRLQRTIDALCAEAYFDLAA